jgi:hypothetical protein
MIETIKKLRKDLIDIEEDLIDASTKEKVQEIIKRFLKIKSKLARIQFFH